MSEARGNESELAVLEVVLVWTELEAGRLDAALAHAARAPDDFVLAWYYEALLREEMGDSRAAALYEKIARFDEDDFFVALVRPRALARARAVPARAAPPPPR